MKKNMRDILRYIVFLFLLGSGIWQIQSGNISFGSGLLGGSIIVFIITTIKQRRIREAQQQGINPLDERTWKLAGMAAYASYVTYALVLGVIILLGSIWGPEKLVNPYNLMGYCLSGIVLLYVVFYYYYNHKY